MLRARHHNRIGWRKAWILGPLLGLAMACGTRSPTGELTPPGDAAAWESRYRAAFDDDYTPEPINLRGRAPHDVRDQRLLAARMGFANVVAQVQVQQVWGRGRYQGRQEQYLEIEIEKLVMGELVKGTAERHLLRVAAEDELPGAMQGQSLVLFLRWAPGSQPQYHHHLMPVDAEALSYIAALVDDAKQNGVLNAQGVPSEKGRRGRKGKGERKGNNKRGRGKSKGGEAKPSSAAKPKAKPKG